MMTGKEIFEHGFSNGWIGKIISQKASITNFDIITEIINPDEKVLMSFNGFLNQKTMLKSDGLFSYVATNKRLIWSRKIPFGKDLEYLTWDNIEHFTFSKHKPFSNLGCITIETLAKSYAISMELYVAEEVNNKFANLILELKNSKKEPVIQASSAADEIIKYKNLLDIGAITIDEYEAKKKQLLGI